MKALLLRLRRLGRALLRTPFAALAQIKRLGAVKIGKRAIALPVWLADTATFLTGVGLLTYGAGLVYQPAGYIVAGVLLIVFTVK